MAAPSNVYVGSLPGVRTTGEQEVLITTSAESTSLLKDRFYLDYFICLDSTAGVGMQGKWAGACIVGSPNYYMHNIARHGWLEFYLNNEKYVVLWDAGLNTLPIVSQFSLPAEMGNRTGKTGDTTFKTAFYFPSTAVEYGVRYKQLGGWLELNGDVVINQDSQLTRVFNFPKLTPNTSLEAYAYIRNAEGEYPSPTISTIVFTEVTMMSYDNVANWGLCNANKDTAVYYDADYITVGTYLFTDTTMQQGVPDGGYSDGDNYYQYSALSGVTEVFSCIAPPMRPWYQYISNEGSAFLSCTLDGTSGAMYYQVINGSVFYFKNPSPTDDERLPSGFYSYMDAGERRVVEVGANGIELSNRKCSEI